MGAPTSVSDVLEILEDSLDLGSVLRFFIPALLGNLPNHCGHSWTIKTERLWRSLAPRDFNDDGGVRYPDIGHLSGRELETKTVRIWTCTLLGADIPPR